MPDWADSIITAPSVGPMQGVQPTPNMTPSSGAPSRPARGVNEGLKIRPANVNRSNAPKNSRPSRIVTPPSTRVMPSTCVCSNWPTPPTARPIRQNTAEKPRTKSAVPATARPRGGEAGVAAEVRARVVTPPDAPVATAAPPASAVRSASATATVAPVSASAPDIPVMYARYPGTSGRQQGDRNVTAPAAAATGMASSSGPDETRLPTLMAAPARSGPRSALAWFPVWTRPGDAGRVRVGYPISLPV